MNSDSVTLEELWEKVMAEPNDIRPLQSWIEWHQEQRGDRETRQALQRAADLPNSWLAKIWLTQPLLEEGRLEDSLRLYQEALRLAPPKSLAVQEISGHLGQAGFFDESLTLLLPIYSPADHGPYAGFNLYNASEDSGNWVAAQDVLDRMKKVDWSPPFKEIIRIRQEKLMLHLQYGECFEPELN